VQHHLEGVHHPSQMVLRGGCSHYFESSLIGSTYDQVIYVMAGCGLNWTSEQRGNCRRS
jgi:hypothetical protein